MIFVLFLLLLFMTWIIYLANQRDLISPSVWLLIGYDVSVLFAIPNFSTWGDISLKTFFVILLAIIMFILGNQFSRHISLEGKNSTSMYIDNGLSFGSVVLLIFLAFLVFVAFIDFRYISRLAYIGGFTSGGSNFMTYARYAAQSEGAMPYSIYIPIAIAQVIAYLVSYNLIVDVLDRQKRSNKALEICCIIVYLAITVLSSGRTMLLNYIIFLLAITCISLQLRHGWTSYYNGKIVKYGILAIAIIIVAFWLIDFFLRASMYGTQRTLWNQLSTYTSSGIYALNHFLENPSYASTTGHYETLINIYSVLNRVGFHFEIGSNALEGYRFANVNTNIYTALRRYIHDFGYIGMTLLMFIQGALYGYAYNVIKNGFSTKFGRIMYCTLIYAVVFNCIEERFLLNVVSLRTVIITIATYVLMKMFRNADIASEI